jgi:hypothetical protein
MVSKVVFYETTVDGPNQVASLQVSAEKRIVEGNQAIIDLFLQSQELRAISDTELLVLMEDAPRRFDGSYLRAEVSTGSSNF